MITDLILETVIKTLVEAPTIVFQARESRMTFLLYIFNVMLVVA